MPPTGHVVVKSLCKNVAAGAPGDIDRHIKTTLKVCLPHVSSIGPDRVTQGKSMVNRYKKSRTKMCGNVFQAI